MLTKQKSQTSTQFSLWLSMSIRISNICSNTESQQSKQGLIMKCESAHSLKTHVYTITTLYVCVITRECSWEVAAEVELQQMRLGSRG